MSSTLAIASVTAALKSLLENRLVERDLSAQVGDVTVTALPPDRIPVGTEERSRLNIFFYRLAPRTGWRPAAGGGSNGDTRATSPALTLDLHYLITGYGERDLHAEILLGHAVQVLHQTPVLLPDAIRSALSDDLGADGGGSDATRVALRGSSLVEQVEQISILPEFLSTEETSRLWSSLQARYRPSAAYRVSAVTIEAEG